MIVQLLRHFMKSFFLNPAELLRLFILLVAVLAYGATGFLYFELPENPDLTWTDGLWYTVVTMTTVGYGDFFPKSTAGRFLVGWPVMFFGIGLLGYALSFIASTLVTTKTKELKGMTSFRLSGHLVIFNFPGLSIVERVVDELSLDPAFGRDRPIVLIDADLQEIPGELMKRNIRFVRGNPTRDETLQRASIDTASHAVILSREPGNPASDNLNISIALAIEARNHKVDTVVECIDPASEELLRKTGCNRIVCTSRFGANFLSQELLNPGVQAVMEDLLSARGGQQIYFVPLEKDSATFSEIACACARSGHITLGVSTSEGVRINPPADASFKSGDRVITIGAGRLKGISF